jgi:hypothetical protein
MNKLDRKDLFKATTQNLLRLAAFLGLEIRSQKQKETDGQYKAHIVLQIQRQENLIAQNKIY